MASTLNNDVAAIFQPIIGQRPWCAKVGVGSFLTFDFGPEVKEHDHVHGLWHLWIYQCEWELRSQGRTVVHSESTRRAMELAVERLQQMPFNAVELKRSSGETLFVFDHFELVCRPYSDPQFEREMNDTEYWMFFTPTEVYSVGRSGEVEVERRKTPQNVATR